jgi:thiamine biosynthesis lipoprotein
LLRSLASECIHLIDVLEGKLSRYFEGGDVYRINHLSAGETLYLSEETYECLRLAMEASVVTGGLFDPTLGSWIDRQKKSGRSDEGVTPLSGTLVVHPDVAAVTCEVPGRVIDLGGIGKGFALDFLAHFLGGWEEVEGGLLSSGASTHLAMGEAAWPIDLAGDEHCRTLVLETAALSASGTGMQGSHIVHPGELGWVPDGQPSRLWALSPTATFADAWSTALMLMEPEEMTRQISEDSMLTAVYIENETGVVESVAEGD